jgi:hypothetical protein
LRQTHEQIKMPWAQVSDKQQQNTETLAFIKSVYNTVEHYNIGWSESSTRSGFK